MSFTEEVKKEIIEANFKGEVVREDNLECFLKGYFVNNLFYSQEKQAVIKISTNFVMDFLEKAIWQCRKIKPINNLKGGKRELYYLRYNDASRTLESDLEMTKNLQKSYYLAGLFVAGGSVSSALSPHYHLEISFQSENQCRKAIKMIECFGLKPKILIRRNRPLLYLKKALEIADFLSIIHAEAKMIEFENARIEKDYFLSTVRISNCEIANNMRIIASSQRQIAAINKIGIKNLKGDKQILAKIRIANPESSTSELAELFGKQLKASRSRMQVAYLLSQIEEDAGKVEKRC